jgi:pyruvate,water dikinase
MTTYEWTAPGPGSWIRDPDHQTSAWTRYLYAMIFPAFDRGYREGFARYGVLIDHLDARIVNGWMFARPRPVGAPDKPGNPPPKLIIKAMFLLHPELRRRAKTARETFRTRPWRQEAERWYGEERDGLRRRNLDLQAVDLEALDDTELQRHLAAATNLFIEGTTIHFRHNPAASVPLGDWLGRAIEWTGASPEEALLALKGKSPASVGMIEPLDRLAGAIKSDAPALAALRADGEASARIEQLRAASPEVRSQWDAYVTEYGHRTVTGFDVDDLTLVELPSLLISTVAARVAGRGGSTPAADAAAARLRERVPSEHRAEYDDLLSQAALMYGLRDDDVGIGEQWPLGLVRRALLEGGRRLQRNGAVTDVEDVFESTPDEVRALLGAEVDAPSNDELHRRAAERREQSALEPPVSIGEAEGPPPSSDVLPPAVARVINAMMLSLNLMVLEQPSLESINGQVTGLGVSTGRYAGRARLVRGAQDFEKIVSGDVLVSRTTTPTYNVVLPLLGAIVTDRGAALSHAAIVAREFGIPAVVGTNDATSRIPDGARVVVDGDRGVVTIEG